MKVLRNSKFVLSPEAITKEIAEDLGLKLEHFASVQADIVLKDIIKR